MTHVSGPPPTLKPGSTSGTSDCCVPPPVHLLTVGFCPEFKLAKGKNSSCHFSISRSEFPPAGLRLHLPHDPQGGAGGDLDIARRSTAVFLQFPGGKYSVKVCLSLAAPPPQIWISGREQWEIETLFMDRHDPLLCFDVVGASLG